MSISMVGIDYNKASVDIRAQFSFYKEKCSGSNGEIKRSSGDFRLYYFVYLQQNGDLGKYTGGMGRFSF